jgi:hypothetical protein
MAFVTHTIGLRGDQNLKYFQNYTSKFRTIRVTIHTTGPWPNSSHSDNHVTIFLLLIEGGAIQVEQTRAIAAANSNGNQWSISNLRQRSSMWITSLLFL